MAFIVTSPTRDQLQRLKQLLDEQDDIRGKYFACKSELDQIDLQRQEKLSELNQLDQQYRNLGEEADKIIRGQTG